MEVKTNMDHDAVLGNDFLYYTPDAVKNEQKRAAMKMQEQEWYKWRDKGNWLKKGEAHEFVKEGNLGIDGLLPCNTSGGQLSEAHLQGINGVTEAVRLIRGTSVNQPKKNDHVLAVSGFGVPASAMILGK